MSTIKTFIKRSPVLTYFALAFAISWGGVLLAIGGPSGIPGTPEAFGTLLPFVGLAMMAGPPVAGILLTGLSGGGAGFREFLSRLLRWRVGVSWYAVVLLTAPLLKMAVLLALLVFSAEFVPGVFASNNKVFIVLFGLAMALGAGTLRGAWLDRVCRADDETALQCPCHRAYCGIPGGQRGTCCTNLVTRRFLWSVFPVHPCGRSFLLHGGL